MEDHVVALPRIGEVIERVVDDVICADGTGNVPPFCAKVGDQRS
jgi:hypothetical protein